MRGRRSTVPIARSCAAVLLVFTAACSSPNTSAPAGAPAAAAAAPPQNTAALEYLAADLPLLPPGLATAVRPAGVVKLAYEFAARHPEVLNYIPCFCGCERAGHKGNHDCFVTSRDANGRVTGWEEHGMACEVCVDVAVESRQMHASGASVAAIREAIERRYAMPGGHGHQTPTPHPPHTGGSH